MHLLSCMGQSIQYLLGRHNPLHKFVAVYAGQGSERGQCLCLAPGGLLGTCPTSSHFTHFLYATGTLLAVAPVLVSRVGAFAFVLGLWGPFKWTLLRDLYGVLLLQSSLVFTASSYGDLSSWRWNPGLCGLASVWDQLLPRYPSWCLPTTCGTTCSTGCCLTTTASPWPQVILSTLAPHKSSSYLSGWIWLL